MRDKLHPLIASLLIGLLLAFAAYASEDDDPADDAGQNCPWGIIEGPDPIGNTDCLNAREPEERGQKSNRRRGDDVQDPQPVGNSSNRPEIGRDPLTGRPFVVWADPSGSGHDIAFSQWEELGWGRVEYLATTADDERDPRAWAGPKGLVYVTWWQAGARPRVALTKRDPQAGGWSVNRTVALGGRRPSIAALDDGRAVVAYERGNARSSQQVVVAFERDDGTFVHHVVATTGRSQPLDITLHAEAGKLWVDWKVSNREIAYAVWLDRGWSEVSTEPWPDPSWSGEQRARQRIRARLLGD